MKKLLFAFLVLSSFGFAQTTCVNCGGGAYASGGTGTVNKVIKGDGAGFGQDSSITDNGSSVASAEPWVGTSSSTVPILGIIGAVTTGIAMDTSSGNGRFFLVTGSVRRTFGIDTNGQTIGMSSSAILGFNASATDPAATGIDTGITKKSAAVLAFGTGAAASTAGFFKSAQTLQVTAANYTTSATTLATAGVITGLSFTAPVSSAYNFSYRCDLVYSQATAAAANLWGITTSGTAPTSMLAAGEVYTSLAGANTDGTAVITSATSTTVVTATPSAFGAIGTTADMFTAHIWGTAEAPSNATPTTFGIAAASGNASDALTIYRGSACWVW